MQLPELLREWNRTTYWYRRPFGREQRRALIRHGMRQRLSPRPVGRGTKAWKRAEALAQARRRDPGVLVWPDYLRGGI